MIVKEFIEWLKTQDQEATVEVLYHTSGAGYYDQGGNVRFEEFTVEGDPSYTWGKHFDYTDFRNNPHVTSDCPYYNKRYLELGSKDN